jgi:hypothetical protein
MFSIFSNDIPRGSTGLKWQSVKRIHLQMIFDSDMIFQTADILTNAEWIVLRPFQSTKLTAANLSFKQTYIITEDYPI